jgi:hypothetical protein
MRSIMLGLLRAVCWRNALCITLATLTWLSPTARAAEAEPAPRSIQGFRSATFGMGPEAVLDAIRSDFGILPRSVERRPLPQDRAFALVVPLMRLNPGPLPATVVYLFDQDSGRLFHINVVWEIGGVPDEGHRHGLYVAQLRLLQYFATSPYANTRTVTGPTEGTGFSFITEQPGGARVSLYIEGVRRWLPSEATSTVRDQDTGNARLMLSYSAPRP